MLQSLVGLVRLPEGNIGCGWSTKLAKSPVTEKQNLINCSSARSGAEGRAAPASGAIASWLGRELCRVGSRMFQFP